MIRGNQQVNSHTKPA